MEELRGAREGLPGAASVAGGVVHVAIGATHGRVRSVDTRTVRVAHCCQTVGTGKFNLMTNEPRISGKKLCRRKSFHKQGWGLSVTRNTMCHVISKKIATRSMA